MMVKFSFEGEPAPKGSYNTGRSAKTGRMFVKNNSPRLKAYTEQAIWVARQAMAANRLAPTAKPVMLDVVFWFLRPESHWCGPKSARRLKDDAPAYPKIDIDKLQRALLDALSSVVYLDDHQVVHIDARKRFALATFSRTDVYVTEEPMPGLWNYPHETDWHSEKE